MEVASEPRLARVGAFGPPRLDLKWVIIGACVALTLYLGVVPLGFLLWQSFFTPQSAAKAAEFTLRQLPRSLRLGGDLAPLLELDQVRDRRASLLAFAIGTLLAWMNERTNTPFKALFFALSIIPLIIPGHPLHRRLDPARQPEDRPHQPRAAEALRHRRGIHQRLLARRHDLGRRAALFADGLPADDRRVPRDGSGAGGVGDHERRERAAGRARA